MANKIIITEWAFDSYMDLVGDHVIISDRKDTRYNYGELRNDAMLLKNLGLKGQSPKFGSDKFWQHFAQPNRGLFEMKWHNFGHSRVQLRVHVYVKIPEIFLLQGYVKKDASKQKREMIKSEFYSNFIDKGQYKFRGELK